MSTIDVEASGQKLALRFLDDFVHTNVALQAHSSAKSAGIVFAGYGIVAPMYGWDDYKNLDVRNKLVIVLGGEPSGPELFKGEMRTWYSTRDSKFDIAAAKGAAAVFIVTDPEKSQTFSVHQTQVTDEVKAGWDFSGTAEDAKWLMMAGHLVAQDEQRPQWKPGSEFAQFSAP